MTGTACAILYALCLVTALPSAAWGQRAAQNANRDADDAFGTTLANDEIGLYGADDIRGFSPVDAGNVRLHGLALDQAASLNFHVIESSSVRLGPSSLVYPFPGASGVVDFEFPLDTNTAVSSGQLSFALGRSADWSSNVRLPLGSQAGLFGGVGASATRSFLGALSRTSSAGIGLRLRVREGLELIPIAAVDWSASWGLDPVFFPSEEMLPPPILGSQRQSSRLTAKAYQSVIGGIIHYRLSDAWEVRAGILSSRARTTASAAKIFSDIDTLGIGDAALVTEGPSAARSTSFDVRISHSFGGPRLSQRISISARGRRSRTLFAQRQETQLGLQSIFSSDRTAATSVSSSKSVGDEAAQAGGFGLAYQADWDTRWTLGASVQSLGWIRSVHNEQPEARAGSRRLWAYDALLIGRVTDGLTIYAGHVQGVEEREGPPQIAVNRLSASSALSTRQYEGGIRWTAGGLNLVGGYFSITKPYYDLDGDNIYARRGIERHEGLEASLSGDRGSLSVVAGASVYKAIVRDLDGRSSKPEGVTGTRGILSLDYNVIADALYLEAEMNYAGGAHLGEAELRAPGALEVTVGARLVSSKHGTLRITLANAGNGRGWIADRSGGLSPRMPRSLGISYIRDVAR